MMMVIEKDWLEKVAIAANVYVKQKGVDEDQIDGFITFLFKVYGYSELLNKLETERKNGKSSNHH